MYRTEYPRPQLVRNDWQCLNGTWNFKLEGDAEWRKIEVPFAFQAPLSGIGTNDMCDDMVYERTMEVPKEWKGKKVILHFGAVDYRCRLYVNGGYVGKHTGGNTSFSFDITSYLNWEKEVIRLEVNDPCKDETIPRGKQFWMEEQKFIWYTRTSGIWQTVWMEPVDEVYIKNVKYTSDVDEGSVLIEYECSKECPDAEIQFNISMDGENVVNATQKGVKKEGKIKLYLYENQIFRMPHYEIHWCWCPENPKLFDTQIQIKQNDVVFDSIEGYFGLRKIETKNGRVYLNNRPYYQKLILDQGRMD